MSIELIALLVAAVILGYLVSQQSNLTIAKAIEALNSEAVEFSADLGLYADLEVKPLGRIQNSKMSAFYFRTEREDTIRESLDIIVFGLGGGLHAFYTNGELVRWTRNGVSRTHFHPTEKQAAEHLLTAVRFRFPSVGIQTSSIQ